jgi:hypothetical protein
MPVELVSGDTSAVEFAEAAPGVAAVVTDVIDARPTHN